MTPEAQTDSAFAGARVIDATQGIGGPFCGMWLADHGADVVKVEPPAGDRQRGTPAFHVLNRGKRSVRLDVETAGGRAALRRLIADADVFLYDWPPADARRLGFDEASLAVAHPHLVCGYLPAYGSRGPYADLPPDEGLVQALAGVQQAQFRYEATPVYINLPVSGYAQGIVAANAVAASLLSRALSGAGDWFEVSGISALFAMETIAWIQGEAVVRLAGRSDPHGPIPTYRLVRASDDWLFAGALTPPFWASMAVAAGLEDCLLDERFRGAPMGIADLSDRAELARRVDAAFATRPRHEWLRILEEANVPRAPALTRAEFARDPQVAHNRMLINVVDPELGPTRQMNVPVWLRGTPGRASGPAPLLGEHQSLMSEAPAPAPRPAASSVAASGRAPLDGITIIDLTGFIAGASGSMLLADLGADVIKVEGHEGDGWRTSGLGFLGCNRGKRSIALDLKHADGRALFLEMAAQADVVMDNFRAGVMDRLGIGWGVLHALNPRLVHCSATGYGPDGPYAHLPGFDPLFQARSGLMRAQGEPGGEPVYLQLSICDYTTALSCAFGVIAALLARERTGEGQRVETCLLNSAFTVQTGEFMWPEHEVQAPPGGRDLHGRHALYRTYAASDGAFMLACTTQNQALAAAQGLGIALPSGDALAFATEGAEAQDLAHAAASRSRAECLSALTAAGVPAAPCLDLNNMFTDEHIASNDLWWDAEHPRRGHLRMPGAAVRWAHQSMRLGPRAPLVGEHSAEVMRQFGISPERAAALVASGVVRQREVAPA